MTNPFKIEIAPNEIEGGYDVLLQVGRLRDEAQARKFADLLAVWLTEDGSDSWFAKVQ